MIKTLAISPVRLKAFKLTQKTISASSGRETVKPTEMKPVGAFVERFSFTTRCCYSMVRALSAVIVMAVSVSGSYLADARCVFVAGIAGLK